MGQSLQKSAIAPVGRPAAATAAEVDANRAGLFRTQLVIQIFPEMALDL